MSDFENVQLCSRSILKCRSFVYFVVCFFFKCTEVWASMHPQLTLINLNIKILTKILNVCLKVCAFLLC